MRKLLLFWFLLIITFPSLSQKIYIEPKKFDNKIVYWFYEQPKETYITLYNTEEYVITQNIISERDCLKSKYDSYIGVRENGNNAGKEVEYFLKTAGLGKGNPWCASFVYTMFVECDNAFILKSPGWVPSWFPQNKLIYVRGKIDKEKPEHGDLIGIYFQEKKRLAHIGFYDSETKDFIISVEGNTNEEGSREGDGVYKKKRIKRTIHSISSWIE